MMLATAINNSIESTNAIDDEPNPQKVYSVLNCLNAVNCVTLIGGVDDAVTLLSTVLSTVMSTLLFANIALLPKSDFSDERSVHFLRTFQQYLHKKHTY